MSTHSPICALNVQGLEAGYEPGLSIVRGASLQVQATEIVTVLGPNGAGKSSFVKAIAGLVPRSGGTVHLFGRDISTTPAHRMVFEGLAFVPQTENVFAPMSVAENLELASAILGGSSAQRRARLEPVYAMFPDLERQRSLPAGRLSGGQRQMVAVARALIAQPQLIILDEPSAGLSPKLVGQVFAMLKQVRDSGVTVLVVEQNVKAALAIADRAVVLVEGRERWIAPSADLLTPAGAKKLANLYLGHAELEAH
jgi:branched-chain amino acid transport system ATP-binding protein